MQVCGAPDWWHFFLTLLSIDMLRSQSLWSLDEVSQRRSQEDSSTTIAGAANTNASAHDGQQQIRGQLLHFPSAHNDRPIVLGSYFQQAVSVIASHFPSCAFWLSVACYYIARWALIWIKVMAVIF